MQIAVFSAVMFSIAIALFASQSMSAFFFFGLTFAFALFVFGLRDGIILGAVVSSIPVIFHTFSFSPFIRFLFALLFVTLFVWAFADIRARKRGGAVHIGRLELFLFSGVFGINAGLFSGIDSDVLPPLFLLLISSATAFFAFYILRGMAERSRGAWYQDSIPSVDAFFISLLFVEAFVALSFLPLSPFTLSATLVTLLWVATSLLIAIRTGYFRPRYFVRTVVVGTVAVIALLGSIPWGALP